MIQCDNSIKYRKPNLLLIDKQQKTALIIDIACPGDNRISAKEIDKIETFDKLNDEILRLWKLKKVTVVPIIVDALVSVSINFKNWMEKIGIRIETYSAKKTTLLVTARILRKGLHC